MRLRAEVDALRRIGVHNPAEVLRIGAAAMAAVVRRHAQQHHLGPAWVAQTLREGGISIAQPSDLVGRDGSPSRFAEYDQAAGL